MSNLEIINWIKEVTGVSGSVISRNIESIANTSYSKVWKININNSPMYLKKVPDKLFLESGVLKILHETCEISNIPKIIAENKRLGCFLMTDCCAVNLREYFKESFQIDIFKKSLKTYKNMQKSTIGYLDEFIALGVPDWRLDKIPYLYQNIIGSNELFDLVGLERKDRDKLHNFSSDVNYFCKVLAAYPVLDCFNSCDLKSKNVLYKKEDQSIFIVDLGESAICHPFFSLFHYLNYIFDRYLKKNKPKDYKALVKASFSGWVSSDGDLESLLSVIRRLYPIFLIILRVHLLKIGASSFTKTSSKMIKECRLSFNYFLEKMKKPLKTNLLEKLEEKDANGYILKKTLFEEIFDWDKSLVEKITGVISEVFGQIVHSVYLKTLDSSILDVFIIMKPGYSCDELFSKQEKCNELLLVNLVRKKINIDLWSFEDVFLSNSDSSKFNLKEALSAFEITLKNSSICIFGEDLSKFIPPIKPGAALVNHELIEIKSAIKKAKEVLDLVVSTAEIKQCCQGIMKKIVRASFCLCVPVIQEETRNVHLSVLLFSEIYPHMEKIVSQAVFWSQYPSSDTCKITDFLNNEGSEMLLEVERWMNLYNSKRLQNLPR
jgi:hypothetical protein